MTRVLQVLPTRAASYGGPVKVAEAFAQYTAGHGIHSVVFPGEGVQTPARLLFAPSPAEALRLLAEIRRADLVHVHGLWTVPTTAAAALCRALKKPYLLTPHGMLDRWSVRRSAAKKRLYARVVERQNLTGARALHFFNAEEAAEAAEFGPLPPYFLLPNGVDVSSFEDLPGRAALDERWRKCEGRTVALYLGRVHPKKGLDVLIPALAQTRDERLLLVIAGPDEGGYRAEVERLAESHGVAERLLWVGPVGGDDKRALLGGADFFVLPSHQEGDSVAIKEALAAGLPVLISTRCHFPEVSQAGAGHVVDDAVEPVREALAVLADMRPEERSRWSQRARTLARGYDLKPLAARLVDVYLALARGAPLPP